MTTGDLADVIGRWEENPTLPSAVCNPISWCLCSPGCNVSSEERQHTHQALEPMVGLVPHLSVLTCGGPSGPAEGPGHTAPQRQAQGDVCRHMLSAQCPRGLSTVIVPILQMRRLRLREIEEVFPGHTAGKWQSWDLRPESAFLTLTLHCIHSKNFLFKIKHKIKINYTFRVLNACSA